MTSGGGTGADSSVTNAPQPQKDGWVDFGPNLEDWRIERDGAVYDVGGTNCSGYAFPPEEGTHYIEIRDMRKFEQSQGGQFVPTREARMDFSSKQNFDKIFGSTEANGIILAQDIEPGPSTLHDQRTAADNYDSPRYHMMKVTGWGTNAEGERVLFIKSQVGPRFDNPNHPLHNSPNHNWGTFDPNGQMTESEFYDIDMYIFVKH